MLTLHIGGVLAVFPWRGLWRLFGILGMYQGAAQYPGESSAYPMGGGAGRWGSPSGVIGYRRRVPLVSRGYRLVGLVCAGVLSLVRVAIGVGGLAPLGSA